MAEKIRVFFAIEIPNKGTLKNIIRYQSELQKAIGPLKLVNTKLMHITLRFLGNITPSQAKELTLFTDNILNPQFFSDNQEYKGKFKGIGDFRKQVFFAKIFGANEILQRIHDSINKELQGYANIQQERNRFTPHLTIARAKRNRRSYPRNSEIPQNPGQLSYSQIKEKYQNYDFGNWDIQKVFLKRSVLTPTGPIYTNLSGNEEN